jgi:CubicO group peptidase (beta-lactamase class C family)
MRSAAKVGKPVVDRVKKEVRITIPNGPDAGGALLRLAGLHHPAARARRRLLHAGAPCTSALPDPAATTPGPWATCDARRPRARRRHGQGAAGGGCRLRHAASAYTAAFVVTYKGRILGERYMAGIGATTPLESWSMGKSVVATLMGIADAAGRVPARPARAHSRMAGRRRQAQQIRISDILHMSSGLRIKAPDDPDFDPNGTYPDHVYYYTGRIDAFNYAATRPQQWPPNTVGRYRNTDPVLASYLVRLAVGKRGEEYLSFPQRALFDKIGIRTMVLETDPYGNFLAQGYDFMSAATGRGWPTCTCRTACGTASASCPKASSSFVSTLAPAWAADKRPIYGGFFWLNGTSAFAGADLGVLHAGRGRPVVLIVPSTTWSWCAWATTRASRLRSPPCARH